MTIEQEVINAIEFVKRYKTETNNIEVKSAKKGFPKSCYDTVSSFANTDGGIIIFGINEEEDFKIEDVYNLNDLQKKITSMCSDAMEPSIRPHIVTLKYEGKNILAVKIEELSQYDKPCYYKSKGLSKGSYFRIGDRDEVMDDYEIVTLYNYKKHIIEDMRPIYNAKLEDLNREKLEYYIIRLKLRKPNFEKYDFDKCLRLCGITIEEKNKIYPTLAGIMVFGEYPQQFFQQVKIACSVIPGTELGCTGPFGERFIDNLSVTGTIEEMLNGALSFLIRNMKEMVIIKDGIRTNIYEYPINALREAIINALIHRDYTCMKETAYISVYKYTDRIEISSPGSLYGSNKIYKLGNNDKVETRNPTIINLLENIDDFVENRNTGIWTIKKEMEKYDMPEPEFINLRGEFRVILKNKNYKTCSFNEQVDGAQNEKSGAQNEKSGAQNEKSGAQNEKSGAQNEKIKLKLEDKKLMILKFCVEPKSLLEIKNILNISSRSYVRDKIIKPLIDENKLDYLNKKFKNAKNQKYVTIIREKN